MSATPSAVVSGPRAFGFEGLPVYSRTEAALATWMARAFPAEPDWKTWIRDALGEFLERPAGVEVRLTQSYAVGPGQPETTHTFLKDEILIGRDPKADICLSVRSIGSRHARLSTAGGVCRLEDLGTSLGTFVNKTRLEPNTARALASGDQFDIFPYSFRVELRPVWTRDGDVQVESGSPVPVTWSAFVESAPRGRICFPVEFSPGGTVLLDAEEAFLEELLRALLLPLGIEPERLGLMEADGGILELLVTCVLARINRDLRFPFHAQPGPPGRTPDYERDSRGLAASFAVRLANVTGVFRLFIPFAFLAAVAHLKPDPQRSLAANLLSLAFPVSAGYIELSAAELATLEPGDVVLYTGQLQLLFPGPGERGWNLEPESGNRRMARIDKSFGRSPLTEESLQPAEGEAGAPRPDLSQVPVRLHIVLGEKELTIEEASALVSGSILDLGLDKTGAVKLAVNGKVMGDGRLVDVEGRLGVRIQAWRT